MHNPEFALMIFPTTRPCYIILPINEPNTSSYDDTYSPATANRHQLSTDEDQ